MVFQDILFGANSSFIFIKLFQFFGWSLSISARKFFINLCYMLSSIILDVLHSNHVGQLNILLKIV